MSRKAILIVGLVLALFWCVGCNTVKGIGKDITTVGEAAEDVVD